MALGGALGLGSPSRADLRVLAVALLRCPGIFHPDIVVLDIVDFDPLSAVPGEVCEASSAGATGLSLKVNRVSPLLPCIFAM